MYSAKDQKAFYVIVSSLPYFHGRLSYSLQVFVSQQKHFLRGGTHLWMAFRSLSLNQHSHSEAAPTSADVEGGAGNGTAVAL